MSKNKIDYKTPVNQIKAAKKEDAGYLVATLTELPEINMAGLSVVDVANTILSIMQEDIAVKLLVMHHLKKDDDNV